MKQAQWEVQNYIFYSDLKLLPLSSSDLVVGMDWLEQFSPMRIDWYNKWSAIAYQGSTILLQGILPAVPECTVVQVMLVSDQEEQTCA